MPIPSGDIKISANFEVNVGKPVDPRVTTTTLVNRNNITFKYKGMQVYVEETSLSYTLQNDLVTWVQNNTPLQGPNVFYVSKAYTGPARATISGVTLASITSSNASYNTQLAKAIIGSTYNPYPDPWSARNAAIDAIIGGTLTKAEIVILSGDWTVGSDDITKNGDTTGINPNSSVAADIQITGANAGTSIPSLYQNNLSYTFSKACTVTYINSLYSIPVCSVIDVTDQSFESSIVGGKWLQIYGEQSGFTSVLMSIDNANAKINFQPDYLSAQQVFVFQLVNYKKAHITIASCDIPDANLISTGSSREGDNTESSLYVKIDQCRFGHGVIPYPDNTDFWYFIALDAQNSVRRKLISLYVGELFLNCGAGSLFHISQAGNVIRQNVLVSFRIENLYHTDSGTGPGAPGFTNSAGDYALISPQGSLTASSKDVDINITIDNAVTQLPLFSNIDTLGITAGSINNRFRFHCGYHKKNPSLVAGRKKSNIYLFAQQTVATAGQPSQYIISGVYKNTEAECVVAESQGSYLYDSRTQLSGRYETTGTGKPVMTFNMIADKTIALMDVVCINDGTVPVLANAQATDSNFAGVRVANRNIVFSNVTLMYGGSSMVNITQVGSSAAIVVGLNNYV